MQNKIVLTVNGYCYSVPWRLLWKLCRPTTTVHCCIVHTNTKTTWKKHW